jgi:hypothetical protein
LVLRQAAKDRAFGHVVRHSQRRPALDHHVTFQPTAVADLDIRLNDTQGSHFHIATDPSLRADNTRGMDACH